MKKKVEKEYEVLQLSGSSYDIGYKHGEIGKEKVQTSLQTYEKMFKENAGIDWQAAREKALLHLPAIEKSYPRYLDEMEGIAKGACVQFEDIVALNARSEIALVTSPDGCTSFALTSPKTEKTWLAQNWDWKSSQIDSLLHLEIEQDEYPTIEMITEAGIIGKIGCNSAGIGVCLNAIVTDLWQPKIPIHLGLRAVLESNTLGEAISLVDDNQMASTAHFLIASNEGNAISVEVSPLYTAKIDLVGGVLVHTNHLCAQELEGKIQEIVHPDSLERFSVITDQIGGINEKDLQIEDIYSLLANHENYPNSICRHESLEQASHERMETVFSIVMNLTDTELSWIKGKPCKHY